MTCNHAHSPEDLQRRQFLLYLAAGAATAILPANVMAAIPPLPAPLAAGRSVYHIKGRAWVNGQRVTPDTRIGPNDTLKTSQHGELVFAVGNHAMLLRGGSHLVLHQKEGGKEANTEGSSLIGLLELFAGKLLSASRNKGMQINTPTATIGVRGTGVYLETYPDKTLFCTCYGDVDIAASHDASSTTSVHATHHNRPLAILESAPAGSCIHDVHDLARPGHKFTGLKHTDAELMMIEALVGRTPPFAAKS